MTTINAEMMEEFTATGTMELLKKPKPIKSSKGPFLA